MLKKDINIRINVILWEMALKKIETDFGKKYTKTDCMLIIMMLALYKPKDVQRSSDNLYLAVKHPNQLAPSSYKTMTIAVYDGLLDMLQKQHPQFTQSQLIESTIADYLVLPITFYTDCISPLYSIIGSKNHTMQVATASAVDAMNLSHESMILVDACCATGSLFFGINTYAWKQVVLNDLNPLRTNFLNVIKREPLKLIKKILNTELTNFEQSSERTNNLRIFRDSTDKYVTTRRNYRKVDCNVDIAYEMFLLQCLSKKYPDNLDKILNRVFRFLPAHLKLQNATITQQDCLEYLKNNDTYKFVLLDVPYIGSEHTCAVKGYKYKPFHEKVAECLQNAQYPFLYYCRSSPPKSDNSFTKEQGECIMKMKLAVHFMNKGFYFQKVHLTEDTELMISNQLFDKKAQFQWTEFEQNIT